MTLTISAILVAKIVLFLATAPFLFLFACFPREDKPTSPVQYSVFVVLLIVEFCLLFGLLHISIGA